MLDPLKQLKRISNQREQLREEYDYWLVKCWEEGYSNVKIARELGLSEAAIRMYRVRKRL